MVPGTCSFQHTRQAGWYSCCKHCSCCQSCCHSCAVMYNSSKVGLRCTAGPGRKYFMLGGKGGVGKTSCSSSLGVKCALEGHTTLVVSTDPAHSLSDSLDQVRRDELNGAHVMSLSQSQSDRVRLSQAGRLQGHISQVSCCLAVLLHCLLFCPCGGRVGGRCGSE